MQSVKKRFRESGEQSFENSVLHGSPSDHRQKRIYSIDTSSLHS